MSQDNTRIPEGDELVICRCERVTWAKIQSTLHDNSALSVNQIKKLTRAGMGPCQGRTCAKLVEAIIAAKTRKIASFEYYHSRPPVRVVHLGRLAACADQFKEPKGPVRVAMLSATDSENE